MIGTPVEIPANRLKLDGVPADVVTAVTVPTGVPVICTGSTTSAPAGGATTGPSRPPASPACRLLFPVVWVGRFPIVMLPWVQLEPSQHHALFIQSIPRLA